MTCSFASKDMFSCEDGLCTGEVGLVELKIAGGIQYPRLRGGNNRHNVLPGHSGEYGNKRHLGT